MIVNFEITFALLTAITGGLTQAVKILVGKPLSSRIAPVASILFGLWLSMGANGLNFKSMLIGLIIGLTASGCWSGVKSLIKG